MTIEEIKALLEGVIYPDSGENIVKATILESVEIKDDRVIVTLNFPRKQDPFLRTIKHKVEELLTSTYPKLLGQLMVIVKEAAPKPVETKAKQSFATEAKNIIAISSGKGGVGKSTVTCNVATMLNEMGYKVGVLDADIYGPSQAKMFGVEDYAPTAEIINDAEWIVPAESNGIKIISIAYFISKEDALIWRGPMATNALKQLTHQTLWGELDFLLIDLPPGTGDIHLNILSELKLTGAIIVSTPQEVALADVVRGINMFKAPKIDVPIMGIIENMAWFTPEENLKKNLKIQKVI